jgi:D-hydroxyproline dehydrogenase subunit beta
VNLGTGSPRRPGVPDVAVVGGGIVGSATAAFLAEGGLRVRLYERTAIAAGASGRNSGVVQHPFDPVLARLYHATVGEYRGLAEEVASFALAPEPAGLLYVGRFEEASQRLADAWRDAWPATRPEVVVGRALERLEPSLAPDLIACRLAIGYPVAPAAATEAFAELARRRGVEIVLGIDAELITSGDRVTGVRTDGTVEPAGSVVVAAGPWTPTVLDPTKTWRPIRASWGVVAGIRLAAAPRHGLEATDIEIEPVDATVGEGADDRTSEGMGPTWTDGEAASSAGRPGVGPRVADELVDFSLASSNGASALGSTFLPVEPDPESWLSALRRVGASYVPAVADAPLLGMRACARPVSLDGRPLVGQADWIDRLWIIAGHGPWGISTGPASARLVADRILGRSDGDVIPAELRVGRFGAPAAVPADQRQAFGSKR